MFIILYVNKTLNLKFVIMNHLTLKESKRIVWLTWLEFLVAGAVVVLATNPLKWYIFFSAILIIDGLCRLFRKSKYFPKSTYDIIPTIFQPSAFFATIIALIVALSFEEMKNSWTLGLIVLGIAYFVASIPESRY